MLFRPSVKRKALDKLEPDFSKRNKDDVAQLKSNLASLVRQEAGLKKLNGREYQLAAVKNHIRKILCQLKNFYALKPDDDVCQKIQKYLPNEEFYINCEDMTFVFEVHSYTKDTMQKFFDTLLFEQYTLAETYPDESNKVYPKISFCLSHLAQFLKGLEHQETQNFLQNALRVRGPAF